MPHSFDDARDITATGLPRFRDLLGGLSGEEREIAREALFPGGDDSAPLRVAETADQIPLLEPFPAEFIDERSPLEEQNRFMSEAEDFVRTPPGGFTTRSGVRVSGPTRHGPDPFTIDNPFTDESLTPEQQKEAVQQITDVQESARKLKRERLEAALKSKWRSIQRIKADPAVPLEQKRQLDFQFEAELRELDRPNIIDIYDVEKGKDSPEVELAKFKRGTRKMFDSRYGDPALSEFLSDMAVLDRDGSPSLRNAMPFIAMRDEEEMLKRKEQLRIEGNREAMRTRIHEAATDVVRSQNHPAVVSIFDALVSRYESTYGKLPPAPQRKGGKFDVLTELDRVFQGGLTPPPSPNMNPRALGIDEVIHIKTPMDLERVKMDVARRRREGNTNHSVVVDVPGHGRIRIP